MAEIVDRVAHHVDLTVPGCKRVDICQTLDKSLYPMNLSTFSEMKRTLPSSATRKKNPSMDSRWGRPSHRNGGSDFSGLLTDTSAIWVALSFLFQVVQVQPQHTSRWCRCSTIFVPVLWFIQWKYWGKTVSEFVLNYIWEEQFSTTCSEHFKFRKSFTLDDISLFLNILLPFLV